MNTMRVTRNAGGGGGDDRVLHACAMDREDGPGNFMHKYRDTCEFMAGFCELKWTGRRYTVKIVDPTLSEVTEEGADARQELRNKIVAWLTNTWGATFSKGDATLFSLRVMPEPSVLGKRDRQPEGEVGVAPQPDAEEEPPVQEVEAAAAQPPAREGLAQQQPVQEAEAAEAAAAQPPAREGLAQQLGQARVQALLDAGLRANSVSEADDALQQIMASELSNRHNLDLQPLTRRILELHAQVQNQCAMVGRLGFRAGPREHLPVDLSILLDENNRFAPGTLVTEHLMLSFWKENPANNSHPRRTRSAHEQREPICFPFAHSFLPTFDRDELPSERDMLRAHNGPTGMNSICTIGEFWVGGIWSQVTSENEQHGLPDGGICCMLLIHSKTHYATLRWMGMEMKQCANDKLLVTTKQTSTSTIDNHKGPVSTVVKPQAEVKRIAEIIRDIRFEMESLMWCVCLHAICTD